MKTFVGVVVTRNGDEWLKNRRTMNKIMLAQNSVNFMIDPCYDAASDLVAKWKKYPTGQVVPDLEHQLYQLSIEVILATLVGKSWPSYRSRILGELDLFSRKLSQIFEYSVKLSRVRARLAETLRLPSWRGFVATTDYCFDTVDRLVQDMMGLGDAEDGMLGRMLADGLDEPMLRRIVADLIIAAGDTTAFALQWLLFLLASNPGAQDRLHEAVRELDRTEVLKDPLIRGTIKETLRLYPIAPFIGRVMPHTDFLDRFLIDRGELVAMSIYTCGRSESHFPRAHEFRPERWLRNDKGEYLEVRNPNASLPFSMGAKSCIGKKLAETQLSLVTAELLKNFKIDCLNKENIAIKLRLITAPSEPLQLQLTARN
ncbi:cytochrome P450 315a1, mitochondrial-like [Copidosoma floridanum]|uniref:cytochrome P450 315a1, mitochondrial-like n=1 Tax=Copidosoma floridanum TaxID=29053 RepID=UPI0006C94B3A|nr:cytochrome P450 315a1, mitochondrial-like [Copidosoma floridanum]